MYYELKMYKIWIIPDVNRRQINTNTKYNFWPPSSHVTYFQFQSVSDWCYNWLIGQLNVLYDNPFQQKLKKNIHSKIDPKTPSIINNTMLMTNEVDPLIKSKKQEKNSSKFISFSLNKYLEFILS